MTIEITGTEQVKAVLNKISPRHARNLLRATVHGIAGEANKLAKAYVTIKTGNLRKSLKAKRKKSPPDKPVSFVEAESGRGVKNDGFYWRFIEHGRKIKSGGRTQAVKFKQKAQQRIEANMEFYTAQQFTKKLNAALKKALKNVRT